MREGKVYLSLMRLRLATFIGVKIVILLCVYIYGHSCYIHYARIQRKIVSSERGRLVSALDSLFCLCSYLKVLFELPRVLSGYYINKIEISKNMHF